MWPPCLLHMGASGTNALRRHESRGNSDYQDLLLRLPVAISFPTSKRGMSGWPPRALPDETPCPRTRGSPASTLCCAQSH